jgi:hypothetical protein
MDGNLKNYVVAAQAASEGVLIGQSTTYIQPAEIGGFCEMLRRELPAEFNVSPHAGKSAITFQMTDGRGKTVTVHGTGSVTWVGLNSLDAAKITPADYASFKALQEQLVAELAEADEGEPGEEPDEASDEF